MLEFMEYVQQAFARSTNWNLDNSYASLTTTSQNILDFETPRSLRIHLSSLASPNFASSYSIGSTGLLDGSISYLFTSRYLGDLRTSSTQIPFRDLVPNYRHLQTLSPSESSHSWEVWHQGRRIDRRDVLLYGRLYLPTSILEALYVRRLSPTTQLRLSAISGPRLPFGGTALAHLERDVAKYRTEFLFSTDSALCGFKALYNFGSEVTLPPNVEAAQSRDTHYTGYRPSDPTALSKLPHGRFSAGGEVYYGILNKSGGLSAGLRFATLPSYTGFPYTMTLTLNPLMGSLSSTYSVLASPRSTLSTRFDFNFYSYESDLQIGTELWRVAQQPDPANVDWARKLLGQTPSHGSYDRSSGGEIWSGCLKAKANQRALISLLWEGRLKALFYSAGVTVDMKGGANLFKGCGVEVRYSP